MGTITLRLPADTHKRIKALAASRNMSMNKLFEEFSVIALTEYDAETRFRARVAMGSKERGLELLDKIDDHFEKQRKIETSAQ